jgi:hypothetical protein
MKARAINARSLQANHRLDAKYFLSPGTQAAERLAIAHAAGILLRPLSELAEIWAPARFKRSYASPGEEAKGYLRPYDIFDYVPQAADLLSVKRSYNLMNLMAPVGALLQTCSGRNLGPAVAVDAHLARFALSHDLIRIEIPDEADRYYALAFLGTPSGQALLRRDKTGSVIDHISVIHLEQMLIPFLSTRVRMEAARSMELAVSVREKARIALDKAARDLAATLPPIDPPRPPRAGWTLTALGLGKRLDAAFHDPVVAQVRRNLLDSGGPKLREVAGVAKPAGRYKTYYVGPDHGRPLLSGRQVLQYSPINLQFISPRSLDPKRYELRSGSLVFQADGRSEERLGYPVVVEPGRDGWLASGHVGRLLPYDGIDPGWLYAACATPQVQVQMKALACGSVVDALYVDDLQDVVLPPVGGLDGAAVMQAWEQFTAASLHESLAIALVETELRTITGELQIPA